MPRDLESVAHELKRRLPEPLVGYVVGKTAMRDAVTDMLGCSQLEAEQLVDMLEARRFARFSGDPKRLGDLQGQWTLHTDFA
jgi:hypothetical protein